MAYMSSTESRVFSRCGPRLQLEPSKPLHTRAGPSKEAILRILGMIASLLGRAQRSTPKPEGARLMRAGLTAKARAEPQWPCFGCASRRDSLPAKGEALHR